VLLSLFCWLPPVFTPSPHSRCSLLELRLTPSLDSRSRCYDDSWELHPLKPVSLATRGLLPLRWRWNRLLLLATRATCVGLYVRISF